MTFRAVIDFALGEMGLKPWEFWELTWPEYESMARGYFVRTERQQWDPMRHLIATILNVNRAKGKPAVNPNKLYPLSFDKKVDKKAEKSYAPDELQTVLAKRGFVKKPDGQWKQNVKKTTTTWQRLHN